LTHLTRAEYDGAYFGDPESDIRRKAGYSNYLELDTNWKLKKKYQDFIDKHKLQLSGRILELGAAVGYFGKIARENNLNIVSVDWSQWCYDNKCSDLTNEDALTFLKAQPDSTFDIIVSFHFIECLTDEQAKELEIEMKRVAPKQIHVTQRDPNEKWYTRHTPDEWNFIFPQAEVYYG